MSDLSVHNYRRRVLAKDLVHYHVLVKETDLWVSAECNLEKETYDLVFDYRYQIENYIESHPTFLTTLRPFPFDPYAPLIVKEMILKTRDIGVGPMASVAGAIAQFVGQGLLDLTDQIIVENGGDIFLKIHRPATVSIWAGESPISDKIGLRIPVRQMPVGICSSSGRVGHSLSMGRADVVCILSGSPILADGVATALGNRINAKADLEKVEEWSNMIEGVLGGVAVMGYKMALWGDIELVDL